MEEFQPDFKFILFIPKTVLMGIIRKSSCELNNVMENKRKKKKRVTDSFETFYTSFTY